MEEADDVRPLARPINSKALGELPKSKGISTLSFKAFTTRAELGPQLSYVDRAVR